MPPTDLLLPFIVATAVFAYMPGPGMLYTTAQTVARGRRAGLMASLGIHLGGYVHVVAAAIGLSVLFEAVPTLYVAVKLLGAAYLVWLGLRLVFDRTEVDNELHTAGEKTHRRALIESVTVEVLNPKTAIFFIAFLPQFTDPAAAWPIWLQLLALGTAVNAMFSSADLACVILAELLVRRLRSSGVFRRISQIVGGSILVILGARLALQRSS